LEGRKEERKEGGREEGRKGGSQAMELKTRSNIKRKGQRKETLIMETMKILKQRKSPYEKAKPPKLTSNNAI
jgi:hypothetical protein